MTSTQASAAGPRRRLDLAVAGRILSGLVILFLAMDAAMKLVPLQQVIDTTGQLGWPTDVQTLRGLGLLTLAMTVLYAWPRTALLGAILMTGYLGGAVATHARTGSPLFSHTLFGVYLGVMAWGGLWMREPRLRALLPLKD
ncbi:MAG: DoxX family protein [Sphingomonadales bacterium]